MKIIILYASCGAGHRRAAEAAYGYIKEKYPAFDLQLIDALQKTSPLFSNIYSYGYLFLVNYGRWLWYFLFKLTSFKYIKTLLNIPFILISRISSGKLRRLLTDENPEVIISTHFLPSDIAGRLKMSGRISSKVINVVTDFGVHPLWICKGTDIYVAASAPSREQLIMRGVAADKIRDYGIPIDTKFSREYDRGQLNRKLGLEQGRFTVLIATGSFGIGRIEEITGLLYKDTQVLVVAARNKRLYSRLKEKGYTGVKVYGFAENMHELMAASDIIITKPGGMTIAESLSMGLVPIFITAVPGQETENARILSENSIGLTISRPSLVRDAVIGFKDDPARMEKMRSRINEMRRPFAAKELCGVIC
ncbi:MAG: glycosyltransferase [Candidatus Omnitrophota bacterium]|jgi:processive 1,2-diacylglycerol beta-glucosyltransferase